MSSIKHEMVATLCLLEGEKGCGLFQFGSESDEAHLEAMANTLLKTPNKNQKNQRHQIKARLLKIAQTSQASPFNDIHPDWVKEKLEGESPRILKIVSDKWSGKETKGLSPEIAELVLGLVAKQINLPEKVVSTGSFDFSNISWLQEDELKVLFKELGIREVVKAFQGVPPKLLKPFFARFSLQEATDLRHRIEQSPVISEQDRHYAQQNILLISQEENLQKTHDQVLHDIGVTVFMKATASTDASWLEWIFQKYPPSIGYQLKRAFYEGQSLDGMVEKGREEILAVVVGLADQHKIRRYWKAR